MVNMIYLCYHNGNKNKGEEITEGDIIAQCKMIKIIKVTEVSNHYE